MKRLTFALVGLFLLVASPFARADWRLEAETGALYQSNLSNSDRSSDVRDDWAWTAIARLSNGFQLGRDLRLSVGADLQSDVWARYNGFDQIAATTSAGLRYRFGLGRQAPWLLLEESIGYHRFDETFRDGWNETIGLRGGVALSERMALEAGYSFTNFATPNDFFDLQGHRVSARMIFDATARLQVGLGYSYREGDVISYAVPARPDIFDIAVVRPSVPTFGDNPRYNAYRLRGRTHAVSVSAGYTLTKYLSLQVNYEFSTTSHDPLRYDNHLVEASIGFAY
jgi:hypothetical protein